MVAFANTFESKTPPRVRAHRHSCILGASPCLNSNNQANLCKVVYDEYNRLESCSKDPIGYVDSWNPYVQGQGMSDRDPSGREVEASNGARIEIQPKAQESNLGNVGCGSAAVQDYEYRIPQGAPCHGVIIQAVAVACLTRQCNQQGCSCPKGWQAVKALEFDHYFELWSFGRGDKRPSNARGLPYIDRFAFAPPEKTCGAYVQFAIAKFFCLTDKISATKQIRDGIKDFRKNGGDARTSCGITSAGLLKSSNGNHNWFNTLPSKAGTSMRTGRVDWSCCGAASDYVFAKASPSF